MFRFQSKVSGFSHGKLQKTLKKLNFNTNTVDSQAPKYKMASLACCTENNRSNATEFKGFKSQSPAEETLRWQKKSLKEISRT